MGQEVRNCEVVSHGVIRGGVWRESADDMSGCCSPNSRMIGDLSPLAVPIPRPSILDDYERVAGRKRWRNYNGTLLLEWDGLHGEVEVYNGRGRHIGVKHPISGDWIKPAVKGRRIDV